MKFTRTANGNVRILDANDNVSYQLHPNHIIYTHATDVNLLMIGLHWNDINAIAIHVPSVTHLDGVPFSGTRNELIDSLGSYFNALRDSNKLELKQIINIEGVHGSVTFNYDSVTPVARTFAGSLNLCTPSFGFYCESIIVSSKGVADVQIQLIISEANYSDSFISSVQVLRNSLNSESIVIPVRQYFKNTPIIQLYTTSGDGVNNHKINVTAFGTTIADSELRSNTIAWFGDSITQISGVLSSSIRNYEVHTHAVAEYLNARLVVHAKGGTTSSQANTAMRKKQFRFVNEPKILFYAFGANDISQNIPVATYIQNVTDFINYFSKIYSTRIVLLSVTPLENNAHETIAITYRNAASNVAATFANVDYIDLSNSFDRTNPDNYSSVDTAGGRVHPSANGMIALSETIINYLIANNIRL